jgi:hypothetical protein
VTTLASGGNPAQLTVDATHVYWRSGAAVTRIPRGGGAAQPVADAAVVDPPDTDIYGIAADANPEGYVYFATRSAIGNIARAKKDGSTPTPEVLSLALVSARTVLVDDEHVYWAEHAADCVNGTEGKVRRTPLVGGPPEDLVLNLRCPQVTQDNDSIIFSDGVKIFRLVKPPPLPAL